MHRSTALLVAYIFTAAFAAYPSTARADTNPVPVAIPALGTQGRASVYPSSLFVKAEGGQLHKFGRGSVILHAVTHPCPEDLAILLVHNNVDAYLLLSEAGGCRALQGTDLRFTGLAPAMPDDQPATPVYGALFATDVVSYGNPVFPAPAPPPPYVVGLPSISTNVGGTWSLYVVDTRDGARGVMASGWSLLYDPTIVRESDQTNVPVPGGGTAGPAASFPITFTLTDALPTAIVHHVQIAITMEHDRPDDLRFVLQSPAGTAVVLMANAGGVAAVPPNTTVIFRDNSAGPVPNNGPLVDGTYNPGSSYGVVALGPPAPPPPYAAALAAFNGESAAGTWKLWALDGVINMTGEIELAQLRVWPVPDGHVTMVDPVPIGVVPSTRPFVRVELATTGVALSDNVQWRVTNWPAFDFYDAGPFKRVLGTGTYVADVPVKAGMNDLTVLSRNVSGAVTTAFLTIGVDGFTYSLAEGATGSFFDLDVTVANVADAVAPIWVDLLQEGGPVVTFDTDVGGNAQRQLHIDEITPEASLSTVVRSTGSVPLAVERTMIWDDRAYGGHGGTSTDPATRWLFAEGSQGFFATYILLANNNATDADVALKFLLEGGGVVNHAVTVPAKARVTVYAGDVPGLVNQSFGLDVTSTLPIIAERAMYMAGARLFEGGHGSAGVNRPERQWYLAEGATGPFFECYILLSNPDATDANVSLRYLLPDGTALPQNVVVPANGRLTINVETVHALLANTPVSTVIAADRGIIVERAMYWPDITQGWQEAHNSFGLTETSLRWGVADGRVGGSRGFETYVLLANPNATPAEVVVRFLKPSGVVQQEYTLPPTSRLNVQASLVPGLGEGNFSAEVRVLNFQPIAVEKAMYWNSEAMVWAGGTNVTATRLPPP